MFVIVWMCEYLQMRRVRIQLCESVQHRRTRFVADLESHWISDASDPPNTGVKHDRTHSTATQTTSAPNNGPITVIVCLCVFCSASAPLGTMTSFSDQNHTKRGVMSINVTSDLNWAGLSGSLSFHMNDDAPIMFMFSSSRNKLLRFELNAELRAPPAGNTRETRARARVCESELLTERIKFFTRDTNLMHFWKKLINTFSAQTL